MQQKRHNRFNYQQIFVLVFILLNGLFTAAPFVHASVLNKESIQNHSNELEGNLLNNLTDEQQECHVVVRNKQKISNQTPSVKQHAPKAAGVFDQQVLFHNAGSQFLIRPQYYSFLSIYYLF